MDPEYYASRCSAEIARGIGAVLEAAQSAREARRPKVAADLEDCCEQLLLLRRDILQLPPQRSAPPQVTEDPEYSGVPF